MNKQRGSLLPDIQLGSYPREKMNQLTIEIDKAITELVEEKKKEKKKKTKAKRGGKNE